jgi:predicted SprT family Zn-dependent metalloprotease
MTTAQEPPSRIKRTPAAPPPLQDGPIISGDRATLEPWLKHYWQKLELTEAELSVLALTQDRQEYARWTGKRLNVLALGCYCFIPAPPGPTAHQLRTRKWAPSAPSVPDTPPASTHRHLIFIEPDMQPKSIEVTVAHELIHLADRVSGKPRRHSHHGYDSIAADEAAITGYHLEELRALLHEESGRREQTRRERRPIRYLYACPGCGKHYPRARKYSQSVSCSSCDNSYNPRYKLQLLSS